MQPHSVNMTPDQAREQIADLRMRIDIEKVMTEKITTAADRLAEEQRCAETAMSFGGPLISPLMFAIAQGTMVLLETALAGHTVAMKAMTIHADQLQTALDRHSSGVVLPGNGRPPIRR